MPETPSTTPVPNSFSPSPIFEYSQLTTQGGRREWILRYNTRRLSYLQENSIHPFLLQARDCQDKFRNSHGKCHERRLHHEHLLNNNLVRAYIECILPAMKCNSSLDRVTAARDFVEKFFPVAVKTEERAVTRQRTSEPSDLKSVCLRKLEHAIERFDSSFHPSLEDDNTLVEISADKSPSGHACFAVHWVLLKLSQFLSGGCADCGCMVFRSLQEDHIFLFERSYFEDAEILRCGNLEKMYEPCLYLSETVCVPCHGRRTEDRRPLHIQQILEAKRSRREEESRVKRRGGKKKKRRGG